MSRVGKNPITIPSGVDVSIEGSYTIFVKGPLGQIQKSFNSNISLIIENGTVIVLPSSKNGVARAMWGTTRSIVNSMILGVSSGFSQEVEVRGVGFRGNVAEKYVNLFLGKSHGTKIAIPQDIDVSFTKPNLILLKSCNKESLGHFIALIKSQRPVEPYKGKGIMIKGEYIDSKKAKKSK